MFVLTTIADTIRIPPSMFAQPTIEAIEKEIDTKYPNRVIYDVGLVISRYENALEVSEGVCVAGDGGAHHEVGGCSLWYNRFLVHDWNNASKLVIFQPLSLFYYYSSLVNHRLSSN